MARKTRQAEFDGKKLSHTRLAEGEATGHFHQAIGPDVTLYETAPDAIYLSAPLGVDIIHQEHKTVRLPPGQYDRQIVREFDHFAEESRSIID